jgi:hypothetical protein
VSDPEEGCTTRSFTILLLTKYYIVIKSRRMRWAGHVAFTGEKTRAYRVFGGKI